MDERSTGHGQPESMQASLLPLEPLWPDANRYWPSRQFPAYRFVPGLHPHPTESPLGHSWHHHEIPSYVSPIHWQENGAYLYGIDLYHQGYLWEAHESWEGIWRLVDRQSGEGLFLQGLIQNAAAQLKLHLGVLRGANILSRNACEHLEKVLTMEICGQDGTFMGLNLNDVIHRMRCHYGALWERCDSTGHLQAPPPRLILKE